VKKEKKDKKHKCKGGRGDEEEELPSCPTKEKTKVLVISDLKTKLKFPVTNQSLRAEQHLKRIDERDVSHSKNKRIVVYSHMPHSQHEIAE
jgi:hypothetical protein